MNFVDPRTVFFITIIVFIICALLMTLLWRGSRKRFQGMGLIVGDYVFQTAGIFLVFGRDTLPAWASVIVANAFVMFGAILGLVGLERFVGKKGPQAHNFVLLALFAGVQAIFYYLYPSLTLRNINFSVALLIVCFQCAWLLLVRSGPELRPMTLPTGIVYLCFCLASLVRIPLDVFLRDMNQELFSMAVWDMAVIVAYLVFFIVLTYSIAFMLNRRLLSDIRLQEEKFSRAFHSSPNAILLTRLSDGTVFDVNDGFWELTGFTAQEVVGKTTTDLRLWADAADRDLVVRAVKEAGGAHGMELNFRKKTGEMLTGLLSADVMMVGNLPLMLSTISDITGQKRTEESVRALLAEKELILKEVHHRIKNNMSVINSILEIQSAKLASPEARAALMNSSHRVQSMMVLYDKLYRADGSGSVSIDAYLPTLVEQIAGLFPGRESIDVRTECEAVVMEGGILSTIGILVTELVTNSMKYAFAGREAGRITVSFRREEGKGVIMYADDGAGLPGNGIDGGSTGFGLQLVSMLVRQLRGTMSVDTTVASGVQYIIEFPL